MSIDVDRKEAPVRVPLHIRGGNASARPGRLTCDPEFAQIEALHGAEGPVFVADQLDHTSVGRIWLIVGGVAGWLASLIVTGAGLGLIGDIVVGIIGAVIAGYLFPTLGWNLGGGFIGAIISAAIGAIILLVIIKVVRRV